jgi:molybdopterin-guanine dinucleotide biosynthesis protein A
MVSAAILVGGRARRFGGRDKSALLVDGRTIRDRQIAALAPLTDDLLIVGSHDSVVGSHDSVVGSRFSGIALQNPAEAGSHIVAGSHTVRFVADHVPDCGPLGGLDAALSVARGEMLILLACDMPFVTTQLLAHLTARLNGADAVVPRTERGYHPLCAMYTQACRDAVARRLARRELALIRLLDDLRVQVIDPEELDRFGPSGRLLANVNTPGEFDDLGALLGHEP